MQSTGQLWGDLEPYVVGVARRVAAQLISSSSTTGLHDLNGPSHGGQLGNNQAPQFFLLDGSRTIIGNVALNPGAKVDGVDLSDFYATYLAHATNADAHHQSLVGIRDNNGTLAFPDTNASISIIGWNGVTTTASSSQIKVGLNLASPSGLQIVSGAVALADTVAGSGLSIYGKILSVPPGDGLTITSSKLSLIAPGALSVSSAGDPSGSHTHAVLSSSQPGPTPSLLRTGSDGNLTLWDLLVYRAADATALRVERSASRLTPAITITQPANVGGGTTGVAIAVQTAGAASPSLAISDQAVILGSQTATDIVLSRAAPGVMRLAGDYVGGTGASMAIGGWARIGSTSHVGSGVPLTVTGSTAQVRLENPAKTADDNVVDLQADAGGNLTVLSGGNVIVDPRGRSVLPARPYETNLGSPQKKYLTVHAAELWVESLVAQQTLATIGGRILVGPTTTLVEPMHSYDTTMLVKHNSVVVGDRLLMEAAGQFEMIAVTAANSNPLRNASFETWDGMSIFTYWTPVGTGLFSQNLDDPSNGRASLRVS